MSTAIATRDTEIATIDPAEAEIIRQQEQEFGSEDRLSVPILKVGQALTKEVQDGDAEAGEFINTLSNEALGTAVEFINCYYNKGRFASDTENRAYVAFGSTIPDTWADLVGPELIGTPFAEYSEAEEEYKRACNAKEREWGKGPLVSTTHNFTGYIVTGDADDPDSYQLVRLSLKRTDVKAADKIKQLQRMVLRNRPAYDRVLKLKTIKKTFGQYQSYIINPTDIKFVRETTPYEREIAKELAEAVMHGRTDAVGAEDALQDAPSEPASGGGLDV